MNSHLPGALIRVDGGDIIGYGHIMRSTGFYTALTDAGFRCTIYTRFVDGAGVAALKENGIKPVVIPADLHENNEPAWCLDHFETNSGLPALTVVDAYHLPEDYWKSFRRKTVILATDVFGGRNYREVDLLFNSYCGWETLDYSSAHNSAIHLMGPEYAQLRPDVVRRINSKEKTINKKVSTILVNGGGVDEHDVTGTIARAFMELEPEIQPQKAYFVTGIKYPFGERLDRILCKLPFAERLLQPTNWLDLLESVDFAMIAGGSTQYEAAAFGTPTLVFLVEENQRVFAEGMEKLGITSVAGWLKSLTFSDINNAYKDIISNQPLREQFSRKGKQLLDGQSGSRVAEACIQKVRERFGNLFSLQA